ncbi:hypothetical protein TNCV_3579071 [Trichonephila clavipes]|nr:hypothetical protein TNCV_3579071 [Trichonephila clavipes]
MLVVLAKATTIHGLRSSTVSTSVSYTSDFRWPQKKKSKELRSGELGGKETDPPRPISLLGYVKSRWFHPAVSRKMCWCANMHELHVLVSSGLYSLQQVWEKWEICIRASFFNPTVALRIPTFVCSTLRLANSPFNSY